MVTIIPAILEHNLVDFERQFDKVKGLVKRVQVDVIDGKFRPGADQPVVGAKNKTLMPEELAVIDTIVEWDWHLMVEKPENWVERCVRGGVGRVFGHIEMMEEVGRFIAQVQVAGMGVGLALDLETGVEKVEEYIWDVDALLLMSVRAGEQGQEFDERVLAKIGQVRKVRHDIKIVIDGGLDVAAIKKCLLAEWAEEVREEELERDFLDMEFAVGKRLLEAENVEDELRQLQHLGYGQN